MKQTLKSIAKDLSLKTTEGEGEGQGHLIMVVSLLCEDFDMTVSVLVAC